LISHPLFSQDDNKINYGPMRKKLNNESSTNTTTCITAKENKFYQLSKLLTKPERKLSLKKNSNMQSVLRHIVNYPIPMNIPARED